VLKRVDKGVKANVLNRFFGQKPQEEPKKDTVASQERVESDSVSEQSFNPLKNSLSRTRQIFSRMGDVFRQNDITTELWDELEESLLRADVGPSTTMWLIERLQQRVNEEKMKSGAQVQRALREELTKLLGKSAGLRFAPDSTLTVILVIGVNGSGKTTTIAKLAYRLTREGHRVVLAAADTFRAAAIDQLKVWAERIDVPVISQNPGSDPGAVVYDAIQAATTRGCDVLIVDTAGRLQTKYNLMEELKKISKVIQKFIPKGPHELLIVMDATTGQNALLQARQFAADIGLTGVVITKLDSTAKGGFAFAVADDLGVPIKFIGTGEKVENLAPFDPQSFVAALFAQD
jgi:fused signal recognition particle receptor